MVKGSRKVLEIFNMMFKMLYLMQNMTDMLGCTEYKSKMPQNDHYISYYYNAQLCDEVHKSLIFWELLKYYSRISRHVFFYYYSAVTKMWHVCDKWVHPNGNSIEFSFQFASQFANGNTKIYYVIKLSAFYDFLRRKMFLQ